jgi:hypothetical protein
MPYRYFLRKHCRNLVHVRELFEIKLSGQTLMVWRWGKDHYKR